MEYQLRYEPNRVIISRYRSGSHNLYIDTGRMSNPAIPRDERLCTCDTEIQTVEQCLLRCPLLQELYDDQNNFSSVNAAFERPNIAKFLLQMGKILKNRK